MTDDTFTHFPISLKHFLRSDCFQVFYPIIGFATVFLLLFRILRRRNWPGKLPLLFSQTFYSRIGKVNNGKCSKMFRCRKKCTDKIGASKVHSSKPLLTREYIFERRVFPTLTFAFFPPLTAPKMFLVRMFYDRLLFFRKTE